MDINLTLLIALASAIASINALRDVHVTVPAAIRVGDTAKLYCRYDMEGDSLYSVKWYKGKREFYRYTPKENPAMKVFPVPSMDVVRHHSNESQLWLQSLQPAASGKYSCEVSADAPSFHTLIVSGDLEVVEPPEHRPLITGIRTRIRIGDIVRGNCTSRHSRPPANLTWTINDMQPSPSHTRSYRPLRDHRTDMETSISAIQFVVTAQHFSRGKLKVRCTARIHNIYLQSTEKSVEPEYREPKVISAAAAASSNSVNLVPNLPYDLGDGDDDKQDTYMTHIQGEVSSLNQATTMKSSQHILPTLFLLSIVLILSKTFTS